MFVSVPEVVFKTIVVVVCARKLCGRIDEIAHGSVLGHSL